MEGFLLAEASGERIPLFSPVVVKTLVILDCNVVGRKDHGGEDIV